MINLIGIEGLFPQIKIKVKFIKKKNAITHYIFTITDGAKEMDHFVLAKKLGSIGALDVLENEIIRKCELLIDNGDV